MAVNNYSRRPDSFPNEEERQYTSTKAEGQWQWDRDAQQMSPQLYSDGKGGNAGRSLYPNHVSDTKMGSNQEQRVHPQEQAMEVGFEDSAAPQTLERLDRSFHNDIMKLMKEQDDAEDSENARHREKIANINNQYQEKLSVLRAQHAARRKDLLQRESHARLQQYQLAGMSPLRSNSGPSDMDMGRHGYEAPDSVPGEPHRQYGGGVQFDSYRQRHESFGRGRMQVADTRVPTPGGRLYNTGPRYY